MSEFKQLAANLLPADIRVGGKYRLGRKVGAWSFGDIYVGTNTQTGEEVAIKLEN